MARRKDAEEDAASKAILEQLQTKTVGAPPSTTGLTGDQLPETIFDVDDFDRVKNQVTLQLSNLELLNVLNTVGQVTNTQSQSGPIPKTGEVKEIVATTSGTVVFGFQPNPGEVYQVYGFSIGTMTNRSGSVLHEVRIEDVNNNLRVELIDVSASSTAFPLIESGTQTPIILDENLKLGYEATGTFDDSTMRFVAIRVR
mgnify:CR=1 FL=1